MHASKQRVGGDAAAVSAMPTWFNPMGVPSYTLRDTYNSLNPLALLLRSPCKRIVEAEVHDLLQISFGAVPLAIGIYKT